MTNIVVLVGRVARKPDRRNLPSGDDVVTYEVIVEREGERADIVPVVWMKAPLHADGYDLDSRVMVVGRVCRRFFRTGGVTQSRTEVIAEIVADPANPAQSAAAARILDTKLADAPELNPGGTA